MANGAHFYIIVIRDLALLKWHLHKYSDYRFYKNFPKTHNIDWKFHYHVTLVKQYFGLASNNGWIEISAIP